MGWILRWDCDCDCDGGKEWGGVSEWVKWKQIMKMKTDNENR
jgi:hypothetical protein